LYCIVLYCIVLYCIVLCCIVLYCIAVRKHKRSKVLHHAYCISEIGSDAEPIAKLSHDQTIYRHIRNVSQVRGLTTQRACSQEKWIVGRIAIQPYCSSRRQKLENISLETYLKQCIEVFINGRVQTVCKQSLCLHFGIQNIELYSTSIYIFMLLQYNKLSRYDNQALQEHEMK
jgi:hypothetical protein